MSRYGFEIDPDITRASTPPSRLYTDAGMHRALQESVFARSWQFAGDADDVRVPGQVHPFTLLPGCLDEPLLLVRDSVDHLRCLSNVCTHRGMIICEQGGVRTSLRCRYHGRRFGMDGSFESMPEFDGVVHFPSERDDLRELALGRWGPLVFVGFEPATAFETWIGPVRDRMRWFEVEALRFDPSRSRDYLVAANWALYCENYLEGFHIPFVHASLNDVLDFGSCRTELFEHGNVQIGVESGGGGFSFPGDSPYHGEAIGGLYYWLFPNLMLNFYPWGLSINVVKPLSVDRTRVSFLTYILDESRLEQGAGSGLDRVEREDEAIVELVQTGVRSRLYDRGRYSPNREQGTHHFHRLLADALRGDEKAR